MGKERHRSWRRRHSQTWPLVSSLKVELSAKVASYAHLLGLYFDNDHAKLIEMGNSSRRRLQYLVDDDQASIRISTDHETVDLNACLI